MAENKQELCQHKKSLGTGRHGKREEIKAEGKREREGERDRQLESSV